MFPTHPLPRSEAVAGRPAALLGVSPPPSAPAREQGVPPPTAPADWPLGHHFCQTVRCRFCFSTCASGRRAAFPSVHRHGQCPASRTRLCVCKLFANEQRRLGRVRVNTETTAQQPHSTQIPIWLRLPPLASPSLLWEGKDSCPNLRHIMAGAKGVT